MGQWPSSAKPGSWLKKPFARDLKDARNALNATLAKVLFEKGQIYTIDHYLGQRDGAKPDGRAFFGNMPVLKPLVEQPIRPITSRSPVAETVGVGGRGE